MVHCRSSDSRGKTIGERLRHDFLDGVQILTSEQPSPGIRRDVGQQEVWGIGIVTEIVTEDHVGQFVQHELLPMQCRLTVRVKHQILAIRHKPDRAQAVVIAEVREFDYAQSTPPTLLNGADELIKSEDLSE